MKCLDELQICGQAFGVDGCEVKPIVFFFFALAAFQSSRTRHRSTAELRVIGIETSRTELVAVEPSA